MTDREIIEDFKDLVEESRQEDIYEYYYRLLNVLNLIQKQDTEINKLKEENEELRQSFTSYAKATEMVDKYIDEIKNDTKKLIGYQEKYLDN